MECLHAPWRIEYILAPKSAENEGLFARIAHLQRPGDLLFLGHSESLFKVSEDYSLIGRTIHRRL